MDVVTYLENRKHREAAAPKTRESCFTCRQPTFGCYCSHVQPFDSGLKVVILIHPIEVKRRIATGRMAHLSLLGSELIEGNDFTTHARVSAILADPSSHSMILYPGPEAMNLSHASQGERSTVVPPGKTPVVFVIDGTWATARKMIRSENLRSLPRICFTPDRPSAFKVRKQPAPGCYSTIEAVHQTLELMQGIAGVDVGDRRHDRLLDVFDVMVQRQLSFVRELKRTREAVYRRERVKRLYQSVGK